MYVTTTHDNKQASIYNCVVYSIIAVTPCIWVKCVTYFEYTGKHTIHLSLNNVNTALYARTTIMKHEKVSNAVLLQ